MAFVLVINMVPVQAQAEVTLAHAPVTVYMDDNYENTSQEFTIGEFDISVIENGVGNDAISSIIMTILFFGIGAFLLMDIQINRALDGGAQRHIEMILHIGVAILVATVSYSFPLLAQFDNTIMLTVKNSFFMAILNIKYSVPVAALNAIPVMLLVYLPELFLWSVPMWALFGFSLIAVINTRLLNKVFEKYLLAEKVIQGEANNM